MPSSAERYDEEYLVIEPYFESARELFLPHFERVRRTALYIAPEIHDSPRHFAACSTDGRSIVVAPEMAELPYPFVIGILFHELGHAVDYLYPGEFVLGGDGEALRRPWPDEDSLDEEEAKIVNKQWARWQRGWGERDDDVVEQTADAIAGLVGGIPIRYAGPCLLQNFVVGEARPQGLR